MSTPTPENARDPANAPLAPPETGISGKAFWTLQRIPAEPTFPNGFAVAAAATLAGAEGEMSQETDRAVCQVSSTQGPWVTIAVAVRTTGDGEADAGGGRLPTRRGCSERGLGEGPLAARESMGAVLVAQLR